MYQPLQISSNEVGLVQDRENFLLPDDAYPVLENAFVWRERIKRKQGFKLLGRLKRDLVAQPLGLTVGAQTTYTFANIFTTLGITGEPNAEISPGTLVITISAPDAATFTDNGDGTFAVTGVGVIAGSSVNYVTGAVTIVISASAGGATITANISYFPALPVMGLRLRELNNINNDMTIAFDTKYAYENVAVTGWQEFIPGTTWTGNDSDFFWSTNYWQTAAPGYKKLFWVTNFSGTAGDPIRYIDDTTWTDFGASSPAPQTGLLDVAGNYLNQCLCLLPFRGRLVAFNTFEGVSLVASVNYQNRIRWAAIGNPLTVDGVPTATTKGAWRDDIRGRGGFLDIPTSEAITAVGYVRDNLVIYCERSTWQLRYTGRSIAPFQIEKVNTELGAESTFSAVQFDTSLVGIGDKGIVECDSYKSQRIDIKIPDLVFQFNNELDGTKRVHGIRDIPQRLTYWIYPYKPTESKFPNRRLVYNYENDSWAIFTDSLTVLGQFQPQNGLRWIDFEPLPDPEGTWEKQNYPWINKPVLFPAIVGGNQQGYVEFLGSQIMNSPTTNDVSLSITGITGQTPLPTIIKSPNHNLETGQIIQISQIPIGTPFATSLNLDIFGVSKIDDDFFYLFVYDPLTDSFITPQQDAPADYVGGGQISVRDNFRIVSKKFNYIDEGEDIELGYLDILMNSTSDGAITLKTYVNYDDNAATNTVPQNAISNTNLPDTFFNSVIPTNTTDLQFPGSSKNWQRVYCPMRGNFVTLEYTLSNSQMIGSEQESDVQIDAQILWLRPAGRMTSII